jgi:hypothetical protein
VSLSLCLHAPGGCQPPGGCFRAAKNVVAVANSIVFNTISLACRLHLSG